MLRLPDLAGGHAGTLAGAVAIVGPEGPVGRHQGGGRSSGMACPGRGGRAGNLVRRDLAAGGPGDSFPAASGQEMWTHPITPTVRWKKLTGPRIARNSQRPT